MGDSPVDFVSGSLDVWGDRATFEEAEPVLLKVAPRYKGCHARP